MQRILLVLMVLAAGGGLLCSAAEGDGDALEGGAEATPATPITAVVSAEHVDGREVRVSVLDNTVDLPSELVLVFDEEVLPEWTAERLPARRLELLPVAGGADGGYRVHADLGPVDPVAADAEAPRVTIPETDELVAHAVELAVAVPEPDPETRARIHALAPDHRAAGEWQAEVLVLDAAPPALVHIESGSLSAGDAWAAGASVRVITSDGRFAVIADLVSERGRRLTISAQPAP